VTRRESIKSLSLSNKALNDNDNDNDGEDCAFVSDVIAKVADDCRVQLVISYHRSQQTLTVNIAQLFGINALTNRSYSCNSNGKTSGITTSFAASASETTRPSFTAVVAAAVAAKNANDLATRNCNSLLYVGLTVLPDKDKCLVTTARKTTNDVVVWNESFNFGG